MTDYEGPRGGEDHIEAAVQMTLLFVERYSQIKFSPETIARAAIDYYRWVERAEPAKREGLIDVLGTSRAPVLDGGDPLREPFEARPHD